MEKKKVKIIKLNRQPTEDEKLRIAALKRAIEEQKAINDHFDKSSLEEE